MNLTEAITEHILHLLKDADPDDQEPLQISLRRKDLAERFECVPSQINYVLRSRFNPERGFLVESQRGGNGYIRIIRMNHSDPQERLRHYESLISDDASPSEIRHTLNLLLEQNLLTHRERLLVEIGLRHLDELSDTVFDLPAYRRDKLRAEWLRRVVRGLLLS